MTKKDYILIADVLIKSTNNLLDFSRNEWNNGYFTALEVMYTYFEDALKKENNGFNVEKFRAYVRSKTKITI